MLCLNVHLRTSPEFLNIKWHCKEGINDNSMKMLNEEFNNFRGLFPLKVYIGGPPIAGKSHFASRLASGYGIPHLHIQDLFNEAKQANDQLAHEINKRIEELKDIEVAAYEKTKKKKDPDIDRNSLKPRIPDDMIQKIVKAKISSSACLNKGFILDGYPRNVADAQAVFLNPIPDYVAGSDPDSATPGFTTNPKIVPQYVVMLEADDAYITTRSKEIPADKKNPN